MVRRLTLSISIGPTTTEITSIVLETPIGSMATETVSRTALRDLAGCSRAAIDHNLSIHWLDRHGDGLSGSCALLSAVSLGVLVLLSTIILASIGSMATERVSPDHAHCSLRYYRVFSCCYRPSPQHPLARLSTETLSAGHTMLSLVSHLDLEQLQNHATASWPPRAWECYRSGFPLCFLFLSLHFLHSTKRSPSIQTIIYHTNHRSSHILIIIPVQHGLP